MASDYDACGPVPFEAVGAKNVIRAVELGLSPERM
jgi:hypothetical protein